MPIEIRSKAEPGRLLHIVCWPGEITKDRTDFCPDTEGLQVAGFRLRDGQTFKPHAHKTRPREITHTQETWIVISGSVLAMYYDVDDRFLDAHVLNAGDCSITLDGGHNYKSLADDSLIIEVKTGPFVGVYADKRLLP